MSSDCCYKWIHTPTGGYEFIVAMLTLLSRRRLNTPNLQKVCVYSNQVVLKDSCSLTISWGNCWVQPVSGLQTQARSVQGHAVRRSWESRQRWMRAAWDWTSFKGRSRCVWPWRVAWRLLRVALHWPTLQTRRLDVVALLLRPARQIYALSYLLFLCFCVILVQQTVGLSQHV